MMNQVYLLLGGNLGDRKANIEQAIDFIQKEVGEVKKKSSLYETAPWGFSHKESFLNQAILVETNKNPQELLDILLSIEERIGRVREQEQWVARTMDIDILFYNEEVIEEVNLTVPHPRLQLRNFVLVPLNEIASELMHPKLEKKVKKLLLESTDSLAVKVFEK